MNTRFPDSIRQGIEAALTYAEARTRDEPKREAWAAALAHSSPEPGDSPQGATLIRSVSPLTGGCVSPAARVDTAGGLRAFVKWNRGGPAGLFQAEAEGLRRLARAAGGGLRVPEVLGVGDDGAGTAWLLLEFIPSGRGAAHAREATGGGEPFGVALGRGMAALHGCEPESAGPELSGSPYGWRCDNFIGPLPQRNTRRLAWSDFWREERLLPQLERARDGGYFRGRAADEWEELLDSLDDLLEGAEADGVSLLHGDFWSGNVFAGLDAEPVVIDPAVYFGHREVDIAMAELFGGFPSDFLPAYEEAWPLRPGYERVRREIYQLYPLLVHVNLFGGGYEARASEKVRRLLHF